MPEGPEVLTVTDMMDFYLTGKKLMNIEYLSGKYTEEPPDNFSTCIDFLPLQIKRVFCKGKLIVIELDNDWYITSHLVMTGSWRLKDTNYEKEHVRCKLILDKTDNFGIIDISELYYIDIRDMGKFEFVQGKDNIDKILSNLAHGFIGEYIIDFKMFSDSITKCKKSNLITKLRDQKSICSGIGNYLISEIMYDSELSHLIRCNELSEQQIKRLYESCKKIITLSYRKGGLSIENFVNIYGEKGTFEQFLNVYRKDGKQGRSNTDLYGNRVVSIKKGQTFWYVKGLQRLERNETDISDSSDSE